MPRVSVIIPTHNRPYFLAQALKSVVEQTYSDWEAIVVADGTGRESAEVVDALDHPAVRWVLQPKQGRSSARNVGLAQASGELIAFLDDDDLWERELLARLIQRFDETRRAVVYTGWQFIDEDGRRLPEATICFRERGQVLCAQLLGRLFFHGALTTRAAISDVDGFNPSLSMGEDWDFWMRIAARGHEFDFVDAPLVLYRVHPANSVNDLDALERGSEFVLDRAFETIPNAASLASREEAFARLWLGHAIKRFGADQIIAGCERFARAVNAYPGLLLESATYYQVICAMQPDGYKGTNERLDLELGGRYIECALTACFAHDVALGSRRALAFGTAFLALAKLHYGQRDMAESRHYLCMAVQANPKLLNERTTFLTWGKSFFPRRIIEFFKGRTGSSQPR